MTNLYADLTKELKNLNKQLSYSKDTWYLQIKSKISFRKPFRGRCFYLFNLNKIN